MKTTTEVTETVEYEYNEKGELSKKTTTTRTTSEKQD